MSRLDATELHLIRSIIYCSFASFFPQPGTDDLVYLQISLLEILLSTLRSEEKLLPRLSVQEVFI